MSLSILTNGTANDADVVMNDFRAVCTVVALYSSTAFDSTSTNNGTVTNSYETALIASSSLGNADYLRIKVTGTGVTSYNTTGAAAGTHSLKIEEKYSGGSYSTLLDKSLISVGIFGGSWGGSVSGNHTIEYIYTLTANDKANGLYLKFTSTSISNNASVTGSFTNICTFVETAV